MPRISDQQLVQIVDAALAEAASKSGPWLVCRPGCTQCCMGAFSITQLDALRLRQGLEELERSDPARAARVRERVRDSIALLAPQFPGNPQTGILDEDEEAEERFFEFANDEPCPVLDPATGLCDLYTSRPITCRVFGPPVRSGPEGGLVVIARGMMQQRLPSLSREWRYAFPGAATAPWSFTWAPSGESMKPDCCRA